MLVVESPKFQAYEAIVPLASELPAPEKVNSVLVVPDGDARWPSAAYLRQGVRAQGWVQLGRVRLGYELWRQFNGFPPSLPKEPEPSKGDSKAGGKSK